MHQNEAEIVNIILVENTKVATILNQVIASHNATKNFFVINSVEKDLESKFFELINLLGDIYPSKEIRIASVCNDVDEIKDKLTDQDNFVLSQYQFGDYSISKLDFRLINDDDLLIQNGQNQPDSLEEFIKNYPTNPEQYLNANRFWEEMSSTLQQNDEIIIKPETLDSSNLKQSYKIVFIDAPFDKYFWDQEIFLATNHSDFGKYLKYLYYPSNYLVEGYKEMLHLTEAIQPQTQVKFVGILDDNPQNDVCLESINSYGNQNSNYETKFFTLESLNVKGLKKFKTSLYSPALMEIIAKTKKEIKSILHKKVNLAPWEIDSLIDSEALAGFASCRDMTMEVRNKTAKSLINLIEPEYFQALDQKDK